MGPKHLQKELVLGNHPKPAKEALDVATKTSSYEGQRVKDKSIEKPMCELTNRCKIFNRPKASTTNPIGTRTTNIKDREMSTIKRDEC